MHGECAPLSFIYSTSRRQPRSTLFPYTTLFRSTKKLPPDVQFRRIPAVFNERWGHDAAIYYSFEALDRKSTRLNSSHVSISYAVFCLKKKPPLRGVRDRRPDHRDAQRPRGAGSR